MSQVLYRRYRPQNFDDLFGQESVKRILTNALKAKRIAHAYLFSGPRGTGKTSVARILAREIGTTGVDLIEIDAASHRGIEDVRALRDTIAFAPVEGDVKIYILDEVHMLTSEAFNALLKTLEEPPPHVYFVLCTTEAHKLPATIISRCQRIHFILPNKEELRAFIRSIAEKEKYEIREEELEEIILRTPGSYRDTLVLLEEYIGLGERPSDNPIGRDFYSGIGDEVLLSELSNFVEQGDVLGFATRLQGLEKSGVDLRLVLDIIIERIASRVLQSTNDNSKSKSTVVERLIVWLEALLAARKKITHTNFPVAGILVELMKISSTPIVNVESHPRNVLSVNVSNEAVAVIEKSIPVVVEKKNSEPTDDLASSFVPEEVVVVETPAAAKPSRPAGDLWPTILAEVKQERRSIEALLKDCEPEWFDEKNELHLNFYYEFHRNKLLEPGNLNIVSAVVEKIKNKKYIIKCQIKIKAKKIEEWDSMKPELTSTTITNEFGSSDGKSSTGRRNQNNEKLLDIAQEVFGGELIE